MLDSALIGLDTARLWSNSDSVNDENGAERGEVPAKVPVSRPTFASTILIFSSGAWDIEDIGR